MGEGEGEFLNFVYVSIFFISHGISEL